MFIEVNEVRVRGIIAKRVRGGMEIEIDNGRQRVMTFFINENESQALWDALQNPDIPQVVTKWD